MLHGRDVVGADVEEGRNVELDAERAVVLEGLARDLHDHGGELRVPRVGEVAPQVGRLGRRVGGLGVLDPVIGVDRADDAAAAGAARRVDDGAQHVGRRGLALRARDANLGHVEVWPAERAGRDERHGTAHVAHDDRGCARCRLGQLVGAVLLARVCHGARLERRGEVAGAKRPALAEEDVALAGKAGVAGGAGHGCVGLVLDAPDEDSLVFEK